MSSESVEVPDRTVVYYGDVEDDGSPLHLSEVTESNNNYHQLPPLMANGHLGVNHTVSPDEIESLNMTIDDLQQKLAHMQHELNSKNCFIQGQQVDIGDIHEQMARMKNERRLLENEISKLQERLVLDENKYQILNNTKTKLEQELVQADETLTRDRRLRAEVEKLKRRAEMDAKIAYSNTDDVTAAKKQLEEVARKKDETINRLQKRESDLVNEKAKLNRKNEELQNDLVNVNGELEREKDLRNKIDRLKNEQQQEIDSLTDSVLEAKRTSSLNIEVVRRREGELEKITHDLKELSERHNVTTEQLKRKHEVAVEEMGKQIDSLHADKSKMEKEFAKLINENSTLQQSLETVNREKDKLLTLNSNLDDQLDESKNRTQELEFALNEAGEEKKSLNDDIKSLSRSLDDSSSKASDLAKVKDKLQSHLDHCLHQIEEERRSQIALASKLRSVGTELDNIGCRLEDELEAKAELERENMKLGNQVEHWRKKFESERFNKIREIEEIKSKLEGRCAQIEDQLEQSTTRNIMLERIKEKLQVEIEEMMGELEKSNITMMNLERKHKRFDKLIEDWKQKCETVSTELAASQNEAKYLAAEIVKGNGQYSEAQEHIESLRRENRNLSEEIKSLMDQLAQNAQSIYEFEKEKKKLEKDKELLRHDVDDALTAKDEANIRAQRLQGELESKDRSHLADLREQEEDIQAQKRQVERQVDALKLVLEAEAMTKRDVIAQKERIHATADQLSSELDDRTEKIIEVEQLISEERNRTEVVLQQLDGEILAGNISRDNELQANRKLRTIQLDMETLKDNLQNQIKQNDTLHMDLSKANITNADLTSQNNGLQERASRLETLKLKTELDCEDKTSQIHALEEKCNKLSLDCVRVSERLEIEETHARDSDRKASDLETMLNEANNRLEFAETNAIKSCRLTIQQLEDRLQERIGEISLMTISNEDLKRQLNKQDRRSMGLVNRIHQLDDHNEKLTELNQGLHIKTKQYRKQTDQAEEEAAQSLARYKAMSDDLERAESRADSAENMINKYRAVSRFGLATGKCYSSPTGAEIPTSTTGAASSFIRERWSLARNM